MDKREIIIRIIEQGSAFVNDGCEVYEFDTYQELFKWLGE
jgi:hypothetical protein